MARGPMFLTDKDGVRIAAVLDIKQYEKLLEELEDLQDIVAFDQAKAAGEVPIPFEQAIARIRRQRGRANRRRQGRAIRR